MTRSSRKITYSALLTAISVCCMFIAHILPLKMPLFVCSICYYIAFERCGIGFGLLTIIASILLMLMIYPGTAIFVLAIFAPYGIIGYAMRKITYKKPWQIAARVAVSVVFANVVLAVFYFLAHIVMPELDLDRILNLVGGYIVLALFVTLFFVVTDYFFREFCIMFNKLLK